MTAQRIELGTFPAPLVVSVPVGDPFSESAVYSNDAGVAATWPAAPVLVLGSVSLTAVLSGASNSIATWTATAAALAGVTAGQPANLRLAGVTVALGRVARPGRV